MSAALPDGLDAADLHEGAWQVSSLLLELLTHGGWLSTADLAARCGVHRDTARRMLRTLERRQWVRREPSDGRDLWILGPELPRIGLRFQELLAQRAKALRHDFDRLVEPIEREG